MYDKESENLKLIVGDDHHNEHASTDECWRTRMTMTTTTSRFLSIVVKISGIVLLLTAAFLAGERHAESKSLDSNPRNYSTPVVVNSEAFNDNVSAPEEDWNPFNKTNPHVNWCPWATCHNSPSCLPCRRRFLIEISSARAGSTSLMDMLDHLPGVRMSGENYNELLYLKEFVDNIYTFINPHAKKDRHGAWAHNVIPTGCFACPAQQVFTLLTPPPYQVQLQKSPPDDADTIIGFKTIRATNKGWGENLTTVVEAITSLFPCSRVVINIDSDTKEQATSMKNIFSKDKHKTVEEIQAGVEKNNQRYRSLAKMLGPRAYWMDRHEWTSQPDGVAKVNELLSWLGFCDCTFQHTIHDNNDGYNQDKRSVDLGPNCRICA